MCGHAFNVIQKFLLFYKLHVIKYLSLPPSLPSFVYIRILLWQRLVVR